MKHMKVAQVILLPGAPVGEIQRIMVLAPLALAQSTREKAEALIKGVLDRREQRTAKMVNSYWSVVWTAATSSLMSTAADTAEQIAFRILTDARPQSSLGSGTP